MKIINQSLVLKTIRKDMPPPQRPFRSKKVYTRQRYNINQRDF